MQNVIARAIARSNLEGLDCFALARNDKFLIVAFTIVKN